MSNTDVLNEKIQQLVKSQKTENLRRLIVGLCLFISVALFFWTSTEAYISISPIKEKVGVLGRKPTYDAKLTVGGDNWNSFFNKANLLFKNLEIPKEWRENINDKELKEVDDFLKSGSMFKPKIYQLFFKPTEAPFSKLTNKIEVGKTYLLRFKSGQAYHMYYADTPEISSLGEGITNLPNSFSYPLRKYWFPPLIVALLAYLFLPRRKHEENELYYSKASEIGLDIGTLVLYAPFMTFPFLIAGSTQLAFSSLLPLTAIFGIFVFLSILLAKYATYYSTYTILVEDENIALVAPGATRKFKVSDILIMQPAIQQPPTWITLGTLAAGAFGSGGLQFAALGQSINLSTMATLGLRLYTKASEYVYIWGSSAGMAGLKNWEILEPILGKAPYNQNVVEIRKIFPVNVEQRESPPEGAIRQLQEDLPGSDPHL